MTNLSQGQVRPRLDAVEAVKGQFQALASPGTILTGEERVRLAQSARQGTSGGALADLAHHLYDSPATIHEQDVREAADASGEAAVVEVVGIVARLSCVDRVNEVLGVDRDELPEPLAGAPTGKIAMGLKRRRGFLPKPPGEIPVALDLVPEEGRASRAMFGPMYMTDDEMGDPHFERVPGLNAPQLETIAARVSYLNQCFY